ncbi:MAG: UDP-N-acetylmuramoyl-L-alanyl-D-glutamate--2,6-diaminopimelate ligase [Candidatus Omnitrophota bacterium]
MRVRELTDSLSSRFSSLLPEDFEAKGISCNSKEVSDNFIFVAIKGTHADGHKFIREAIHKGAKAVVVHSSQFTVYSSEEVPVIPVEDTREALARLAVKFYGNPSSKVKVIGVTGTNGKTTITYLLEALLEESGFSPAVIGTINYRFKDNVIPSGNTTPGPVQLQSLLADMAKDNVSHAIMEVSSHALSQKRTEGIDFHSAIFTNLAQDHLDYHKTLEDYFQAKAQLFRGLGERSFAVINNDDKYARTLAGLTRGAGIITYAIDSEADVTARDIRFGIQDTVFAIKTQKTEIKFKSGLIGRHNIYNLLASVSWAFKEGMDIGTASLALGKLSSIPGRMEKIGSKKGFQVFVDYAHTEDALINAISSLRQLSVNKIIVVFGCGGERDKTKRPKMGQAASELADHVIITSDNPRSEDPIKIIEDIEKGIRKDNYVIIPDRKEAIEKSISMAGRDDIVLIAGKGHENKQVFKSGAVPFDDREIARECLMSR